MAALQRFQPRQPGISQRDQGHADERPARPLGPRIFFHPSTHLAQHARGETPNRIITGGSGVYINDRDGKRLLDAFAGLYCVNVGYGRTEIAEAIAAQARELAYYHAYVGHGTEASITLARMILERAPKGMSKVYFGLGGSDANETNIKLVWYYNNILGRPEKKKIISRWRGYHGSGLMTGSLTGLEVFHKKFDLPLPQHPPHRGALLFPPPRPGHGRGGILRPLRRRARGADRARGRGHRRRLHRRAGAGHRRHRPAAGGLLGGDPGGAESHDILLIADEVVTGFGRLGSMFGSDHYGIEPDIITIAKGLTSAYAPLSGSIVGDKVWKVLERGTDEFGAIGHGWTYSAHPIGAAAGIANLKLVDSLGAGRERRRDRRLPPRRAARRARRPPHVGEVRGEGMLAAVEFVEDRDARRFFDPARKVGPQSPPRCSTAA